MGFEPPPGDPAAISGGLRDLGTLAQTLATSGSTLTSGFATAESTWHATRKQDFTTAGQGLTRQVGDAKGHVDSAVAALHTYATKLGAARDEMADLKRRAAQESQTITAGAQPTADPSDVHSAEHARGALSQLESQADQIRTEVRTAAHTAAGLLDGLVEALLPGGSHLSPAQIAARLQAVSGVQGPGAAPGGTMTLTQAWAALSGAMVPMPPAQWRTWAAQYGLAVPADLDPQRGLALRHQLQAQLAQASSMSPADRAAFLAKWSAGLSAEDRTTLAMFDPAQVGNLDGMPNNLRYAANKVNLAGAVATERQKLADWKPPPGKDDTDYVGWTRLQGRIAMMDKLLNGQQVDKHTLETSPYQVLAFTPPTYAGNTTTDDGRLAVVNGNLDTASHVGVFVPGITNRIDNFDGTLNQAANARDAGAPGQTATIAWLGYDTPEFSDAVTDAKARAGGHALSTFLQGVQRAPGSDLTLMAHSYGTLVTSKALQEITSQHWKLPDRTVLFGSPGLGQDIHSAHDLGLPDGYPIYALRAADDPVELTASWGTDPADMPGVTRLTTDPWGSFGDKTVSGHSAYTDWGSASLRNIAGVLMGETPSTGLKAGGKPINEDGLAGPYSQDVRDLIDNLEAKVPPDVQSKFASAIEAQIQLIQVRGFEASDIPRLTDLVRKARDDSGMGDYLSQDDVEQAIKDAGFTDTTGHLAGDWVRDHTKDLPLPGPFGDWASRGLGAATDVTVKHLSDWAVDHLPSLDSVLGGIDAVYHGYQFVKGAWHTVSTGVDNTLTFAKNTASDAWDAGKDFAGDVGSGAKDLWDDATGWL